MTTEIEQRDAELFVLGDEIRETLEAGLTASVRWAPGSGTAYELLIVPWTATVTMGQGSVERPQLISEGGHPGWVYVARGYVGALYPIRLWDENREIGRCPHPSYITEKLADGRDEDGYAIYMLLCSVAGIKPDCAWAQAGCWP